MVRPECVGIVAKEPVIPKPPPLPYTGSTKPAFLENDDPEKYNKQGNPNFLLLTSRIPIF